MKVSALGVCALALIACGGPTMPDVMAEVDAPAATASAPAENAGTASASSIGATDPSEFNIIAAQPCTVHEKRTVLPAGASTSTVTLLVCLYRQTAAIAADLSSADSWVHYGVSLGKRRRGCAAANVTWPAYQGPPGAKMEFVQFLATMPGGRRLASDRCAIVY